MESANIRKRFLDFFEKKGHAIIPSSPVIPHDDPTLLFSNAGMNQFKDVFLGRGQRTYRRAATSQKCIRAGGKHNDLENVGHTSRHLTFFEMLGNFSFGDYFKKEAIDFAWEVTTKVFEFDEKLIWPTVFREDDEAFELWTKYVPAERITRMDEKDNFWMMGETGPCGPCSELYFDKGERFGQARRPSEDEKGERFLEFWNLVFMQYNRLPDGSMERLAKQSIDTGSGLERVISLKMGVDSLFETDVLLHLIHSLSKECGKTYDPQSALAPSFRVIADHLRSLSFAIADGAQPSNIERGYVLRKILRRSVRYAKNLGFEGPFLAKLLPSLIDVMGSDYPELQSNHSRIAEILTLEEEAFWRTLKRGGRLLADICSQAKQERRPIRGEEAFNLKDTYGLPFEEIKLLAHDESLTVDEARFQELEKQARELSRSQHKKAQQVASNNQFEQLASQYPSQFVGYDTLEQEATVQAILVNAESVQEIEEGVEATILLDKTPFYAEKGGQVADTGILQLMSGQFSVQDVQSPFPTLIVHTGKQLQGKLRVGDRVQSKVNEQRRRAIQRSHTATHLLHWALVQVLGPHIQQKGSLVDADQLRFDFSHHKPVSNEQLQEIERLINEKILLDVRVCTYERAFSDIQSDSSIKQFFADKYGNLVRVVDIDFSKELCGGTHVQSTSQIGQLRLSRESSIASGVRRLEALTGFAALAAQHYERDLISQLCNRYKTTPSHLQERLELLSKENEDLQLQLENLKRENLHAIAQKLVQQASTIGKISYVEALNCVGPSDLIVLSEQLRHFPGICVLTANTSEKVQVLIRTGSQAQDCGLTANRLIQDLSHWIDGRGGGKNDQAQAGGKRLEGLDDLLKDLRAKILTHAAS